MRNRTFCGLNDFFGQSNKPKKQLNLRVQASFFGHLLIQAKFSAQKMQIKNTGIPY